MSFLRRLLGLEKWVQYAVTDWVDAGEMVIGAVTTAPTYPTGGGAVTWNKRRWRRVGDSMEIVYTFSTNSNSGAAGGSGSYLFPLPPGYSIDPAKWTFGAASAAGGPGNDICGTGYATHLGGAGEQGAINIFAHNSTNFYCRVGASDTDSGGADAYAGNIVSNTTYHMNEASGIRYNFTACVPIYGWTSKIRG